MSSLHTLRVMGCSLAWQNCPCSYPFAPCSSAWMKKHFMELPCTAGACPYDHMFACAPSSDFSFVIRVTLECSVDPTDPKLTQSYWPAHSSIESITLNQFKPKALCLECFHFSTDHFFCLRDYPVLWCRLSLSVSAQHLNRIKEFQTEITFLYTNLSRLTGLLWEVRN